MKKQLVYSLLISLFIFSGCYEDESVLEGNPISDIEISGLENTSIISYTGERLQMEPTVKCEYPEEQLEYAWYMYLDPGQSAEEGYRAYRIASTKNLDYEVNLPSGTYNLIFEVTSKSNNYRKIAKSTISVSTVYSKGFYILKETSDGNTDLDLYNAAGLTTNIINKETGANMPGKPRGLSIMYNNEYINPDDNKTSVTNIIHVITENNAYKGFRSDDMTEVFNNSNIFYEEMDSNEQPYLFTQSMFNNVYFSNTGIRYAAIGWGNEHNTGKFGYPINDGASEHAQTISNSSYIMYWNNTDHKLYIVDNNFISSQPLNFYNDLGQVVENAYPNNLDCIASGSNTVASTTTNYFLCENPDNGDRYLLLANDYRKISKIINLESSLHIAKSKFVAANGLSATIIYCVSEDNKLYAYSWENNTEQEINLPGIPTGESITYIRNEFFNLPYYYEDLYQQDMSFDKLIVCTQSGTSYKTYIYNNLVGGQPVEEPETIVEGTGKVKSVRYIESVSLSGTDLYFGPIYPTAD